MIFIILRLGNVTITYHTNHYAFFLSEMVAKLQRACTDPEGFVAFLCFF